MRWIPRRFTSVCRSRCGAGGSPAPGGSYGTWYHYPCVWFYLCSPIEAALPTGTWDQQLRACSRGWAVPAGGRCGQGGLRIARARRDIPNGLGSVQIHAGLSKSMWHLRAERGPGAGRFVWVLEPLPLCVLLLVQADRKDTSHRALGSAAESTL